MSTFSSKRAAARASQVNRPTFALTPVVIAALAAALGSSQAAAATFTIGTPATPASSTTAQSLGASQTGTINLGSTLAVNGSTVAVTITGNNASLLNLGTLSQTGSGRAIRDATGVTGLNITNGSLTNSTATIQTVGDDVIQMKVAGASVTLNNYGILLALNTPVATGVQAVDFNVVTGANVVNNFAGALIKANEGDAVRPGANGIVNNAGKIYSVTTTGSGSDGVDAQLNSGVVINNAATGVIEGGRHGITGGQDSTLSVPASFSMTITNAAGGVIQGDNGSGVNIDANPGYGGKETVFITNSGTIVGNGITGDGDGVDVDGLVNVTNNVGGVIRSTNAFSTVSAGLAYSEGLSVGGGTITNAGLIEGLVSAGNTNAMGIGITLTGDDLTATTREGIYANATVNNLAGGVIRGQNSSAIVAKGLVSGFTVTINNAAGGTIVGGGTDAAIQTGLDNDTVNNSGLIDGSISHKAIDLGAGNNVLNITGGAASVLGSISGGIGGTNTLTITPGAGNTFSFASAISNFDTVIVNAGTVALSGVSTYSGTTTVNAGGTLELDGVNRLSPGSALDLEGGTLKIVGASGVDGQTFASLALGANSIVDLDGSELTFNALGRIVAGKTLAIEDYLASSSSYAFRLLGDYSTNADFLTLLGDTTIDSATASFHFDGIYTDVTLAAAAVPEPANVALLLSGFGLLGLVARRRKTAQNT